MSKKRMSALAGRSRRCCAVVACRCRTTSRRLRSLRKDIYNIYLSFSIESQNDFTVLYGENWLSNRLLKHCFLEELITLYRPRVAQSDGFVKRAYACSPTSGVCKTHFNPISQAAPIKADVLVSCITLTHTYLSLHVLKKIIKEIEHTASAGLASGRLRLDTHRLRDATVTRADTGEIQASVHALQYKCSLGRILIACIKFHR